MTESMNQLIPIFEDIIKANNFITFAYSSLDDRWFYLSMKAGDDYDSTKILGNLNQAYAYMLEECQYYWLKRNRLLQPDLTVDAIIASLSPEIHGLLDAFLEPYVKAFPSPRPLVGRQAGKRGSVRTSA